MRFCWHKWSRWSAAYDAYSGTRQSCVCEKCGKLKIGKVTTSDLCGSYAITTGSAAKVNKVLEVDER